MGTARPSLGQSNLRDGAASGALPERWDMQGRRKGQGKAAELEKEQVITAASGSRTWKGAETAQSPRARDRRIPSSGLGSLEGNRVDPCREALGAALPCALCPECPRSTVWFDTTPCLPEPLLRAPWFCATHPEILLKEDFGGVEGAHGVDVDHCLEGVEGQGTGWAQEVPRSTCTTGTVRTGLAEMSGPFCDREGEG